MKKKAASAIVLGWIVVGMATIGPITSHGQVPTPPPANGYPPQGASGASVGGTAPAMSAPAPAAMGGSPTPPPGNGYVPGAAGGSSVAAAPAPVAPTVPAAMAVPTVAVPAMAAKPAEASPAPAPAMGAASAENEAGSAPAAPARPARKTQDPNWIAEQNRATEKLHEETVQKLQSGGGAKTTP